ncbi:hypothetical protein VFC49_08360 [Thermococcus sp. SY098]|uniref:hypothetical protein n=1 Tax=Thermococcus sp. SY098 TaxID=3111325 RepID=UPI002D785354|nr:hypothetical protein [Thermococcus sp. SY098]WRS52069.1 hypothetical protein VFC49_08360 [Thermococcus sp. SY098]
MELKTKIFLFSIFINVVILVYSAYCGRVFGHEGCGYTFVGVSIWTIGIILAIPNKRTPAWYGLNKFLSYPLDTLVAFTMFLHSSGFLDFITKTVALLILIELAVYHFQKRLNKTATLAYYSGLLVLAGILFRGYPLIQLTYIPFVVYCAMNLLQLIK